MIAFGIACKQIDALLLKARNTVQRLLELGRGV